MKKVLLAFLLALGIQGFSQQVVSVMITVNDNNGFPVANQTITGTHQGVLGPVTITGITDVNGVYLDSLLIAPQSTMTFYTAGGGCADSVIFFTNPATFFFSDTLVICGSGGSNCNFTTSAQSTGSGSYAFSSTYQGTGTSNYLWTFGDGNSSTSPNPTHTYAQSGLYLYCLQVDNCPVVCDSLFVTVPPPPSCQALWIVDTVNSINFAGNIVLWNLSSGGSAMSQLTYSWDWGDGTTSSGQYPMHTYSDTGVYNICLSIFDQMTGCTDTFCDSVGFDANGNLIYKGTSFKGFTIVVIDPATIGEKEIASELSVDAYPNPSSGLIYIESDMHRILDVNVFNMNGQLLQTVSGGEANSEAVLLSLDKAGLYLLQIQTDAGTTTKRLMVE